MKKNIKKWGFRGMKSKKASIVKKAGHKTENILAFLIGVPVENILTGTGKIDLTNKEGDSISLKSSHDKKGRSQICLYSYDSDYFKIKNVSAVKMKECLEVFPKTKEEYRLNRLSVKKNLQPKMVELKNYINASNKNKKEFLSFIFFTTTTGKTIDFLIVTDQKLSFYVFDASEVVDTFCKKTIVENSKARHPLEMSNLKVLFKGKNEKGKYVNLIENEIRTSTHYRRFLSVGNKTKYLFVLLSNIKPHKKVKDKLILCGKAISSFKF